MANVKGHSLLSLSDNLPRKLASFSFIKDLPLYAVEKPYEIAGVLSPAQELMRTNTIFETHEIPIYDIRSKVHSLDLASHGLQIFNRPDFARIDITTDAGLKEYLESAVEFLRGNLNAEKVVVYHYNFRKSGSTNQPGSAGSSWACPDDPVFDVHSDATRDGGPRRIRRHISAEESEKYFDGTWRLRIINIWRPLNTVKDAPLGFCDPFSLNEGDLLATDRPNGSFVGEIYYLRYNSGHRFYWLSGQGKEEMSVWSSYDSVENGISFVPHASFLDTAVLPSSSPRESIEIRAIVISRLN